MSDVKHTPGPWHSSQLRTHGADPRFNGCDIGADNNANVAIVHFNDRDMSQAEVKANARLIAAAPDLLECLIDARAFIATTLATIGDGHRIAELVQDFDTAIDKAEGRS